MVMKKVTELKNAVDAKVTGMLTKKREGSAEIVALVVICLVVVVCCTDLETELGGFVTKIVGKALTTAEGIVGTS